MACSEKSAKLIKSSIKEFDNWKVVSTFPFLIYIVYVLYSVSFNKIHIGSTSDFENRLSSHNIFAKKGYTIKYRPWVLLFKEDLNTKTDALKREKQLKTAKRRETIWEIVHEKFPS